MPALDFKSFLAGFATQAQKIEEESAKIGRELIEEAIEDFREQAKDYKTKKDGEIKEYDELARRLLPMLGNDHVKVKMVLQEGKGEALNFIQKAESTAARKGFKTTEDLITYTEDQLKSMGGKDISAFDFIRSGGVPSVVTAPPRLDMSEFAKVKTGVFGRQISPEAPDRISRISETYIGEQKVPATVVPKAQLEDLYDLRQVADPRSESETRALRRDLTSVLASSVPALEGLKFDPVTLVPNYTEKQAAAGRVVDKHVSNLMRLSELQRERVTDREQALTTTQILDLAESLKQGDVSLGGYYSPEKYQSVTFDDKPEDLRSFYSIQSDIGQYLKSIGSPGSKTPPPPPPPQGGGANTVSAQIMQSTGYLNIVNPSSTRTTKKVAPLQKRKDLVDYLVSQGVDQTVAVQHAQDVIK